LALIVILNIFSAASDPTIWEVNTRAEVLKGEARGVSVMDTGTIVLAPKLNKLFDSGQSYVWSSAVDAAGNAFLGTGNDGKIFRVGASGAGALFYDTAELDVTALAIGRDGALYAGTSPDGKVYRIDASGKADVFFDPLDKYIWSLAVLNDGSLAVGSGENGKIYRVRTANAAPDSVLLFDTSETHIISLAVDKQGNLYAGTDANGLVLRFSTDGKPFALLDAPLREIHDLAVGNDGSLYVLALSDSASASRPNPSVVTGQSADGANVSVAVTSMEGVMPEPPPKSRNDLATAKSAVFRISPDGASRIVWSSATITGFSILANPNGNGCLIGTSDKGRIYSVSDDGRETLLLQSNEGQISTLNARGDSIFATSSSQGRLYSFGSETLAEGTYESSVRDAKSSALWGRIWWNASGNVQLQTRTGNTQKPDETWSDWSTFFSDAKGAQISSPKARFLQWRAVLKSSSSLNDVSVSYLTQNIAPEILAIQILPTNIGLLATPQMPVDPNIESSGLDPTAFGMPAGMNIPPRRVYRRGARAIQWTAEDRNGDKLEYSIYYRETNNANFKLLRDGFRENFFTFDALSLPDGRYVFKIAANDSPSNPLAQSLSGEKISEPVDIDNAAPTVISAGAPQILGEKVRVGFEATDSSSFITRAEYSVDGGEWQSVYADDGISDGVRERYTFDVSLKTPGEYSVTLRVFDSNGNSGSARVLVRR